MKLPFGLAMVLVDGLAPSLTRWAVGQERVILREGVPLDAAHLAFAESLGIPCAGEIRVARVERIPLPVPWYVFRWAAARGFPVFAPGGMALGRGVYLVHGQEGSLRHELVHVAQYQRLGGISAFMRTYLRQCLVDGYLNADLEEEARVRSR